MNLRISAAELCQIAKSAYEAGDTERGDRYYNLMVASIHNFCERGNVDGAIGCELMIYRVLVKFRETEESAEEHFSRWRDAMHEMGLQDRDESAWGDGNGTAFITQTLFPLGHIEVLYNTCKVGAPKPIYVIGRYSNSMRERFNEIGCEVISALDALGEKTTIAERLRWIRDHAAKNGIGRMVWNSTFSIASYAMGLGLARKQIIWSHRFHPYIPGATARIAYGNEAERDYHGHKWLCCRPPSVDWDAASEPRTNKKSGDFTFGTIARDEKIEAPEFLDAVCQILNACPDAHYEYTGRVAPQPVCDAFRKAGVYERCHYIGWVDPVAYVSSFDVFLETFPLGGICALYALAQGVPVVALRSNHNPLTHGGFPVQDDVDDYVTAAASLYNNTFGQNVARTAGFEYIDRERKVAVEQANRFFSIVESV